MNDTSSSKPYNDFLDPLVVTPLPNGKHWRLDKPFRYGVGDKYSEEQIEVEAGFLTDFASVNTIKIVTVLFALWIWISIGPRNGSLAFIVGTFLAWAADGRGRFGAAPVLHDYLYWPDNPYRQHIDRKTADQIYLEAMQVSVQDLRGETAKAASVENRLWALVDAVPLKITERKWLMFKSRLFYIGVRVFGAIPWWLNILRKKGGVARV